MGLMALGRQEIHTAEPLVPELSVFDVELAIEKLKSHKSPGIDHIPTELIKAGGGKIRYEIHKLISIWNKEELPEEWKDWVIVPIHKKSGKTDCSNYRGIKFYQLRTKFYSTFFCQGSLHWLRKLVGIINVDFDATGQLLIILSAFVK